MSDDPTRVDRRRFLKVLGVSGAGAAALSGCSTDKVQKLIPYLVQSEDQVPGIPTYYASTCTECATGCGLHVKTREGRAIKLEGNPEHPVNAGTMCARGEASLQGLYNPDRLRFPMARNAAGEMAEILWDEGVDRLADAIKAAPGRVAVVSGAGRGTFDDLLGQFVEAAGGRLVRYEAFDHEAMRAANQRVFGTGELPAHDFTKARYILSFGADFLETWLAPIENQRGFAQSHGFDGSMAKSVYVGPRMSLTGMNADEWISPKPGSEASLALGLADAVANTRSSLPPDAGMLRPMLAAYTVDRVAADTGLTPERVRRLFDEFATAEPTLAVAGGLAGQHRQAVELCAAVNILNYVAGNVGRTVLFGPALAGGDGYGAMLDLQRAMAAGEIDVLIVHEANPVFSLPASSGFKDAMGKVKLAVSTSLFLDETAAASNLLLPNLHSLERWDDARPRAGVHGLMQPVMEPVFKNMATGDLLLAVAKKAGLGGFDAASYEAHLKSVWAAFARSRGVSDTIGFWRQALMKGGVYDAVPAQPVRLASGAATVDASAPALDGDGEFVFVPAATSMYYDGRGANRPWLLENPDPVTKITWGSWVEVHPETAARLDVREGEIVRLTSPHGSLEGPVYVYPGLRPDVVSAPLGLGHTEYGQWAKGRGANALDLLGAADGNGFLPYVATKVQVTKTGGYRRLAKTEGNTRELGRHITETMSVAAATKGLTVEQAYREAGGEIHELNTEKELEALHGFRESQLEGRKLGAYAQDFPQWGMVVDLARCTGCSACVTACYAENNIPWVGEADVLKGRELSWMRVERYFHGGEGDEPFSARVIPVMCQQCDNAPCEPVCPVYAAYHTADGLNGQVYNRCVGTRYCANNCPYKVRYFNWYPFARRAFQEPLNLQLNPDVTVRARGVMEKCTFCIQRIRGAQNTARLEDRPLKDGDVTTACAQACPSGAITFGNVKDPTSRVNKAMKNHRGYHVLEEINVRPAVTYLAKVLDRTEA
jgi:anaerobic selenocysteine-containing dehydrogenase/Fe-S-cluster-containing dehydrogenase component